MNAGRRRDVVKKGTEIITEPMRLLFSALISLFSGSSLHVHMTLNHGFPPPESTGSSEEKTSECEATSDEGCLRTELRAMRSLVCDLKAQIADMRQSQSAPRTEQVNCTFLLLISRLGYCFESTRSVIRFTALQPFSASEVRGKVCSYFKLCHGA